MADYDTDTLARWQF